MYCIAIVLIFFCLFKVLVVVVVWGYDGGPDKYLLKRKRNGLCSSEPCKLIDQLHLPLTTFHLHKNTSARVHSPTENQIYVTFKRQIENICYLPGTKAKGGGRDEQQEPFEERVLSFLCVGCCGAQLSSKGDEPACKFTSHRKYAVWLFESCKIDKIDHCFTALQH